MLTYLIARFSSRLFYSSGDVFMYNKDISSARTLAGVGIFAALTLLATSVLRIPTPAFGYVHIGDCFVLLSGMLLGPVCGGLAAGIGSALSDLLAGYAVWVPGTFAIKFLTAAAASLVLRRLQPATEKKIFRFLPAGLCGEIVMTAGYFLYNILIVSLFSSTAGSGLAAAAALSLAEIPFNLIQGAVGIALAAILYPVFVRNAVRAHLCQ